MKDKLLAAWHARHAPSLRSYLIFVIVVATVPLGVLTSWLMIQEILASRQQMSMGLQRAAASLALLVEREQVSSIDALTILANSDALKAESREGFHRLLSHLPKIRPYWSRVYLMDVNGQVVLSNDRPYAAQPQPRPQPVIADMQEVMSRKVPHVSNMYEGVGSRGRGWVTRIDVPVLIDDRVRYVLSAEVDAQAWQKLLESVSPPQGGFVTIFDGDERVVARSRRPQQWIGQALPASSQKDMGSGFSGFHKFPMLEGGKAYEAWQRLPSSSWGVGVGMDASPVDLASFRSIFMAVAAGLLSVLAGVGLSFVVVRRVNQPLKALATGGAMAVRADISVREIAQLRDAMLRAQTQREQAWEHLDAQATEFETLFNASPIGLSITQDPACRTVLRNPAKMRMFCLDPGQTPTFKLYVHGHEMSLTQHPLQRAARGETVWSEELEVIHDDGRRLTLLAHAVPLLDAQGQTRGAIATFVDITERTQAQDRLKQAQMRLQNSQHLVELAQEAGDVGFFDFVVSTGQVTLTSGLARLLGLPPRFTEMPWQDWFARIHTEDASATQTVLNQAWSKGLDTVSLKFRIRAEDGTERWLSSRMALLYEADGQPLRMIGVMVDVTAQQLIEQERARLISQEQKARQDAENANKAKDEFLAMLGHELRNPLSAITAAIEVLNRVQGQQEPAVRARLIINRQTRHLARLMDDLLDVARVIAGKIRLSRQPLNLGETVSRLVNSMKANGQLHDHALELDVIDVWVQADAMRLEQIVTNLVTNAAKYSPASNPIRVVVSHQERCARLQVMDRGAGIPENLLPRIFDLFVQGERTLDRRQGGLGIGLTLVKSLVELHDGKIFVNSTPTGSTFTVELPLVEHADVDAPPPAISAGGKRHVVVVEDNPDGRQTMRDMLELNGHQVWTEGEGPAGLARILAVRPHVALVDIGLPGLSGYEVAQQARAQGYEGWLVALSGYGQHQDVQQALDSGFDAHMVKPLDEAQFEYYLNRDRSVTQAPASLTP
ncbi:MAG: ATP-binding protein [Acidobacteriota bacterium]